MEKVINILHISDVHFGCSDLNGEQGRIVDGISDAILESEISIDIIVFTGDLTQSAQPSEFQQGQDWLVKLSKDFEAKIVIVPGNHDADRSAADKDILRTSYANQEAFNVQKKSIYKSHPHLTPFLQWFKLAKSDNECFINTWDKNPAFDNVSCYIKSRNVNFLCLNSALISCCDKDEGALCLDIAPINSALGKSSVEDTLTIAIGHHPLNNLAEWNKTEFQKLLGQETGPHCYLHGHVHTTSSDANYSGDGAGFFQGIAGATYPGSQWIKSFTILSFDCEKGEVKPSVFNFSDQSGKWFLEAKNSRPVPVRLPNRPSQNRPIKMGKELANISYANNDGISIGERVVTSDDKYSNPFSDVMANGMDPEAVHRLFVDQSNSLQSLSNHVDTIIEGQRGTGKTMLLRYFSFEVQNSLICTDKQEEPIVRFRQQLLPFGLYCCLSNAGMNRSDYEAIASRERRESLFIHRFVVFVISMLFGSLQCLVKQNPLPKDKTRKIQSYVIRLLKLAERFQSLEFGEFCDEVLIECNFMLEEVDTHVASTLPGAKTIDFNPWLSISNSLLGLFKVTKECLEISAPFFVLIDDFDLLDADQQSSIFKTAAIRNHSLVCFKFGIMSEGQKTFMAGEGRTYREGDDYHLIQLNWVDRGLKQESAGGNYASMVDEISRRRMQRAGWPSELSFKNLFNNWEYGDKIRKSVRDLAQIEYDEMAHDLRPTSFSGFWEKQGDAKYFRHLKSNKIEHRYAGPSTIIDLSSGIFRQFLEINSSIVNSALASGWTPKSGKKIGQEIQNKAIRDWSRDMLRSLGSSSGDISTLSKRKFEVTSQHLVTLAGSLSQFFAARLYSDSKDPEVIAIAVKGDIQTESFARSLLEVAVRESVLQRRSVDYSGKSSRERLPTFLLNRRLVPHVGIGTKLQGRHEIDVSMLVLAATNTTSFLAKVNAKKTDSDQLDLI